MQPSRFYVQICPNSGFLGQTLKKKVHFLPKIWFSKVKLCPNLKKVDFLFKIDQNVGFLDEIFFSFWVNK